MILSGNEIGKEVEAGNINIDPFNPKHLNSTSVDLTLGSGVTVYEDWTWVDDSSHSKDGSDIRPWSDLKVLDTKKPARVKKFKIDPDIGWVICPNVAYLMHTVERIHTEKYVPILDGKSSIGRLFIQVHSTAGFGDPGFNGQYTLEVTTQFSVRVYPGMRFCQMRFQTIQGEVTSYKNLGHYTGDQAKGAVASRAYETTMD
jgi:dCTP deaminase